MTVIQLRTISFLKISLIMNTPNNLMLNFILQNTWVTHHIYWSWADYPANKVQM